MIATAEALAVEIAGFAAGITLMVAGLRGIIKITKTIDGQLEAMNDNTSAVNHLTVQMEPLSKIVEDHEHRLGGVETRVESIERGRRMTAVEDRVEKIEHPPDAA